MPEKLAPIAVCDEFEFGAGYGKGLYSQSLKEPGQVGMDRAAEGLFEGPKPLRTNPGCSLVTQGLVFAITLDLARNERVLLCERVRKQAANKRRGHEVVDHQELEDTVSCHNHFPLAVLMPNDLTVTRPILQSLQQAVHLARPRGQHRPRHKECDRRAPDWQGDA